MTVYLSVCSTAPQDTVTEDGSVVASIISGVTGAVVGGLE